MGTREKFENLKKYLRELGSVCIAFSGGVDSTFLLAVASEVLNDKAIAVTVHASMHTKREYNESVDFASKLGVNHIVIEANEYSIKEFVDNDKDRCYYCKRAIFTKIKEIALENETEYVADGTNVDDDNDYRPGMRALNELGVVSPLKMAGLTKQDIRDLSKQMNLLTWDKPSFACLASRIPYGMKITPEKLSMVEAAEEILIELGFRQFRVRHHGDIARIELPPDEIRDFINKENIDDVVERFKKIGFTYVTLDLEGYRMGSLNETIK